MPAPLGAPRPEPGTPASLLDHVAAVVRRLLDADCSKIYELAATNGLLLLRAGAGWAPRYIGRTTVPAGTGSPAGLAIATRKPVIVADCLTERRCAIPPLLRDHGVRSTANVPITAGAHVYGALSVGAKRLRTFTAGEVRVLEAFADLIGATATVPRPDPRIHRLGEREREVLSLVARGYTSRAIAARLAVSAKTVETYRVRLARKLDVRSRPELVRLALHAGLLNGEG